MKTSKAEQRQFMTEFEQLLDEYGDYFFSTGSTSEDYKHVMNVLSGQGYWSGCSMRFYFDEQLKLDHVEARF